jgi:hypothetical protein
MISRRPVACAVAILVCCCCARGDEEPQPDLSTPKGTAMAFVRAIIKQDEPAVKALWDGDDDATRYLDALLDQNKAYAALADSVTSKLGEDARKKLNKSFAERLLDRLEKGSQTIDGDAATLQPQFGSPELAMHLRKSSDGAWRVRQLPDANDTLMDTLTDATEILKELTGEVADGKFDKVDDVNAAMHQREVLKRREHYKKRRSSGF